MSWRSTVGCHGIGRRPASAPRRPGAATTARAADLQPRRRHATGHTILDLGPTLLWGGAFGPPRGDGRPGIVGSSQADANDAHVRDLSTGADLGTYRTDKGCILKAALTADGKRLALTTTIGDLIVLDLAKLAHAHRPQDAVCGR